MERPAPSYHLAPSRPKLRLPAGACDTHCHIFGPQDRFPFAPDRAYTPADAPKDKLFAVHAFLGIERSVIVQSASHGFDNSAVADALIDKRGAYKGVALLPTNTPMHRLAELNKTGFCGVRFNYMKHLGKGAPIEDVLAFAKTFAELGWHLQIHFASEFIEQLAPRLKQSPVPVVIDHMGRVDASLGLEQPAFRQLLHLMEDERFWVKVSGCERSSRQGAPYRDAVPFARKLVAEFGDRTLWGTDWPHPNIAAGPPDDGILVDLLSEIAPSEQQRQRLLVENPARFYRFT